MFGALHTLCLRSNGGLTPTIVVAAPKSLTTLVLKGLWPTDIGGIDCLALKRVALLHDNTSNPAFDCIESTQELCISQGSAVQSRDFATQLRKLSNLKVVYAPACVLSHELRSAIEAQGARIEDEHLPLWLTPDML